MVDDYSDNVRENVSFLGERALELAADEIDRSKQLDNKAAGSLAVAVALTGAAAAFAARLSDLPGGYSAKLAWAIELSVALCALLAASGFAVWALAPRVVRTAVAASEVKSWATRRVLEQDPTLVRGSNLRASSHSALHARDVSNLKATRIGYAVRAFAVALACIVVLTIHLAVHSAIRERNERPTQPARVSAPAAGAAGGRIGPGPGRANVPAAGNGP